MLHVYLLIVFAAVVVLVDGIGCLVSIRFNMRYARWIPVSMFFYGLMGFAACVVGGWQFTISSGAYVGLVDATLGWGTSWMLGPGRLPAGTLNIKTWLGIASVNVAIGCAAFSIAGGLARYFQAHGFGAYRG